MTGAFSLAQASLQFLLVAAGGIVCWSRHRLARHASAKAFGRSAGANHVLSPYSLRRLFQRRKAACLRHPRGCNRGYLLWLARAPYFERAHATTDAAGLGNGHVHSERRPFHAHRLATAAGHERPRSGYGDARGRAGDRSCFGHRAGSFCLDVRC